MATKKGRAEFLGAHDPETRARREIDRVLSQMLKEGKERWEYEADFRALTRLASNALPEYRKRYAKHIVMTAGRNGSRSVRFVWCASTAFAAECAKIPGNKLYTEEG